MERDLRRRPSMKKAPARRARPAITPMTMPAMAPPEREDEEDLETGVLLSAPAVPVDALAVPVDEDADDSVIVLAPVLVAELLDVVVVVPERVRVEKGVGSTVCVVAVTLLIPRASSSVWLAVATETPELGEVKLLMHTLIWFVVVVQVSPAAQHQAKEVYQ